MEHGREPLAFVSEVPFQGWEELAAVRTGREGEWTVGKGSSLGICKKRRKASDNDLEELGS